MNQYKTFLHKTKEIKVSICYHFRTVTIVLRVQITEVLQNLLYDCLNFFKVV